MCCALPLATAFLAGLADLRAQATTAAGSLAGRVLDAGTGQPVPGAVVTLEPATTGLLVAGRAADGLVSARVIVTGAAGAYRFRDVVPGRYRLRVERLGYRAATLEVAVLRPADASVSVALELEPIVLEPVQVEQLAAPLFLRSANRPAELDEARRASERVRQSLFLAPDARMLTYADVMDGVTLGEGDIFRALQRFPGVATRDDYTAELWTRGAPWTHTRVTFDGVPLFNPVHAVGVLSAIAPEVLGSVFFHPAIAPAAAAGGAAGLVDLRSRPGGGTGGLRGVGDLSLASAKLVLEQRIAGRGAWILAGRRSHLDVVNVGIDWLGLDSVDLPYIFHDIAGRADLELGARARLEASGLWEQDRVVGDVEGVLERTTARWGNTAGRIALHLGVGGLELSQAAGVSRFAARTDERLVRARDPAPSWTEPPSRNEIEHVSLAGELSKPAEAAGARWSIGYDVAFERGRYEGPLPRYYAVKPDTTADLRYRRERTVGGLWGDVRFAIGERITLNPAVRLEVGDAVHAAPPLRVAPRLAVRYTVSGAQSISAAVGRSWQYTQALALAGPSVHPAFHASHFWIWADRRTPALRADVASIGTERWLGDGWLASGTAFVRRASGMALPDPTPGRVGDRPTAVAGTNDAHGVELGVRRIGAAWSMSFGYTWGESLVRVGRREYPSPADRRHTVDAMLAVRLPAGLRLAAAFVAMSGAPFTRAYAVTREGCNDFGFGCNDPDGSYIQAPNAERTPAYASLDASLHWTRTFGRIDATAYVQLRNVLDRDNASTYSGSRPIRRVQARDGTWTVEFEDRFEQGLPRLPLAGVRVVF